MNSFDFELPGEPDQLAPFKTQSPQTTATTISTRQFTGTLRFDRAAPIGARSQPAGHARQRSTYDLLRTGTSATPILRFMKNISLSEAKRFEFRAEFFNVFNHTQFFNPDGNITDGSQFGQVIAG